MKENERTSLQTVLTPFFPEAQSLLPFSILWISRCNDTGAQISCRFLAILLASGYVRLKQFAQLSPTSQAFP